MGQEGYTWGVRGDTQMGGLGWVGIPLGPFHLTRAGPHLPFERDRVVTGAASHLQHRGTGCGTVSIKQRRGALPCSGGKDEAADTS